MKPFNFAELKAQRAAMTPDELAAEVIDKQEREAEVLAKRVAAEHLSQFKWHAELLAEAARHLKSTWRGERGSFSRGKGRDRENYTWVYEYPGVLVVTDKAGGFRQAFSKVGHPAVLKGPVIRPAPPAAPMLPGCGGLDL
jgi:hypothetical protein